MFKIVIYIASILALSSCTNSIEFGNNSVDFSRPLNPIVENIIYEQNAQYQSSNKQVDILLVIDNSKSMADEHAKMIQRFQDNFIPHLRDLNWRMGVLTTDANDIFKGHWFKEDQESPSGFGGKLLKLNASGDTYFHRGTVDLIPLFHNTIRRIGCNTPEQQNDDTNNSKEDEAFCSQFNGLEQPFRSIIKSINKKDVENNNFFRNKAHLITIIISDEDEDDSSGLEAQDILDAVTEQWPQKVLRSYSISVLPEDQQCKDASSEKYNAKFGTKLFNLSQLTQGASLSICNTNYAPIFNTIGKSIYNSFLLKINLERIFVPGSLQLILDPKPKYSFHYVVQNQQLIFKQPLSFDTTFIIKYLTPNIQK